MMMMIMMMMMNDDDDDDEEENGCERSLEFVLYFREEEAQSPEILEFVEHTRQIMQQGLDRHLFCKEDELIVSYF